LISLLGSLLPVFFGALKPVALIPKLVFWNIGGRKLREGDLPPMVPD